MRNPKERLLRAFEKPNSAYKFRQLRQITGVSAEQLNTLLAELRSEGRSIVYGKRSRTFYLSRIPTPYHDHYDMSWMPRTGKFAAISDTHLCSVADRIDLLNEAYDLFVQEGISVVLHCGDLLDGQDVYPGHIQFLRVVGAQAQAIYAIQNYPKRDGLRTYFISGNHEGKMFQKSGVDEDSMIVQGAILNNKTTPGREDMVYLGQYSRTIVFPDNLTVELLHPHASSSVYGKSYPQQKRSRAFLPETRPDMQLSGHLHCFSWIVEQGTHMIALPGVQDETEFFKRLGYTREMGCCIIHYEIRNRQFYRVKVEHISLG